VVHNPTADGVHCDRCSAEVVQREDDAEDTVQARLETYERDTEPVLAWLGPRSTVLSVNGARPIEQVKDEVRAALAAVQG
jgi:adenylate kinase